MISNFNKIPITKIKGYDNHCWAGWINICDRINTEVKNLNKEKVVVIDCYHGVNHNDLKVALLENVKHSNFIDSANYFKSEEEINKMVFPYVTNDRVFGFMSEINIDQYFNKKAECKLRSQIADFPIGVIIVYGEGAASLCKDWDVLIYADMARWEIQQRFRRNEISNLGIQNLNTEFSLQYKQAYFVDWRVCDRHKQDLMEKWNFILDTNTKGIPKMITNDAMNKGLRDVLSRPFRVVPFFDPGPWGGQWMKEVCDLDKSKENYAWCFDCVPEENSLLLSFGNQIFELPSINLVFKHPKDLLGMHVFEKFGKEFPIRFDFLDTMDGGNLSLQVHPTNEYIKKQFGMNYTQDESYYMLDAKEDAFVYLGTKTDADPKSMIHDLYEAQDKGIDFDAEKHMEKWPVKKHDHVLIPAGTIHCSGKDCMVLEISATPYIFTFKLWDWGRLGMDGKPRPINIAHGEKVIEWNNTTDWVGNNLINNIQEVATGEGWKEERTGLHKSQFIETRRHWFTNKVSHHTNGGVNVLNLIEGDEVIIESPSDAFDPYIIHYAETFIIPANVGDYTISPNGKSKGKKCATIKAFVKK